MAKHLIFFIALVLTSGAADAQLQNGSFAPDFTVTDINGTEHNLYDYLSQGYRVYLDIGTTWCQPCWLYHLEGEMDIMYDLYGPEGSQEMMVIFIEADDSTTLEDLNGTGGNTMGDWVTGTEFPIVDEGGSDIAELYEVNSFPTTYTICPDGAVWTLGNLVAPEAYAFITSDDCQPAVDDAALISFGQPDVTCNDPYTVSVELLNVGTQPLTSASIVATGCLGCPIDYNWIGILNQWETTVVDVGMASGSGDQDLLFILENADMNQQNNDFSGTLTTGSEEGTSWWNVDLTTDCFPQETTWEVWDSDGNVVESGGPYSDALTTLNLSFGLPSLGCYTFVMKDTGGDGLNGAADAACGVNGSVHVWTSLGTIYSNEGNGGFSEERANGQVATLGVEESVLSDVAVYPNPADQRLNIRGIQDGRMVSLRLTNAMGQAVQEWEGQGAEFAGSIDLSEVSNGLFLLELQSDGAHSIHRVMVQH